MMMKNSMTMNHPWLVMTFPAVKSGGNKSSQFTRLMMKMAAAPYPSGTTEHHLRIRGTPNPNNFGAIPAAAAKAQTTTTTTTRRKGRKSETLGPGLGDPCLDLFFGIQENTPRSEKTRLLKQLLPAAWSHDPLTTLKLICNLHDLMPPFGKGDNKSFYRAAVWLHHNHPKTLASNVVSLFGKGDIDSYDSVGNVDHLAQILKRLTKLGTRISESEEYRLLLDRFSDLFAHRLRSNLEDMNKQELLRYYDCDLDMDCSADRTIFLLFGKSIAKKLFPRESHPEYQGLEESLYVDKVRDRLRDEVLAPLNEYIQPPLGDPKFGIKNRPLEAYLKAAAAGSLLPHEIVRFACDFDRDVAQLYWERMVEDVYLKQGKFKNCLVVCNTGGWASDTIHEEVALSLAVLVSQLSGGPWKGKVISSGPNPELHNLPGSDLDLLSNCAFLKRMDCGLRVDVPKVFDLILQAAANANLLPDQMIKKVFLVDFTGFDDRTADSWESDYQAILTNYKEKGYGQDAVPQIVHWTLHACIVKAPHSRPGLATLTGFSKNLFESFLDNGGHLGPHHVVESAVSGPQYRNLVVID